MFDNNIKPNKKTLASIIRVCLISLCVAQVYTKMAFGQSWEVLSHAPTQGKAECVAAHPKNSNVLFIGTNGDLYASFNRGKDWKRLMGLGPKVKIHRLYFDSDRMFLLTSEGLFESRNEGKHWTKIFRGAKGGEQNVLSLSRDPQNRKTFYLGTEGGLFLSRDGGQTWQKETNELARQWIYELEVDPENNELFIASEKGLYRAIIPQNRFDRVYVTRASRISEEMRLETEAQDELDLEVSADPDQIHTVVITHPPSSAVAIGTRGGVLVSEDEGARWERLPLSGLRSTNILDLVYSPKQKTFFVATENGIYIYDRPRKHWKELPRGFPLVRVNQLFLVSDQTEILYALTTDGIYQIKVEPERDRPEWIQPFPENRWNFFVTFLQYEPTVGMIQKQAIRYANVSNWKTRRWQWASRLRALIPSFSVGKNFSMSDNIDVDRGATNAPDVFIMGPPDKSQAWDFDLKWDLADLIWNSAQTSIDSRDKSMVELRDNILSETTRLYFERRRAQAEFILKPPEDPVDRINALLRIDELTAALDALTGGYFTKELNRLYVQHPEFEEIWKPMAA